MLKQSGVEIITAIDGKNRSKDDLEMSLMNVITACQSKQEQIDKAERVDHGTTCGRIRRQQVSGLRLRRSMRRQPRQEKWRLVEDGWDCRIKYALNDQGEYVEVERFGNEITKDPNGIMADKETRHRPTKDTSDRLFYSPSIRQERVDTLQRIYQWFNNR